VEDNSGKICSINGNLKPVSILDTIDIPQKNVVYEIIRVIDGVPLFFEKHYSRMQNSIKSVSSELAADKNELRRQICNLVCEEGTQNCNVKIIAYNIEGKENILMYISKSYYPGTEEISTGVPVGLMHFERSNPNAKIVNNAYKHEAAKRIAEGKVFEVLLVNNNNKITEGSKSNVFFIVGNKVVTSPDSYILKGITREYIFEACKRLNLEIVEKLIGLDELDRVDGLFISGTSIKVLPVYAIEHRCFKSASNPVVISIKDCFDEIINQYVNDFKN
jgi:branched-chain amino acid aminotransferase